MCQSQIAFTDSSPSDPGTEEQYPGSFQRTFTLQVAKCFFTRVEEGKRRRTKHTQVGGLVVGKHGMGSDFLAFLNCNGGGEKVELLLL